MSPTRLPLFLQSLLRTSGISISGFTDNWWIGLAMFHTLFTWEHNHVCDLLAAQHPNWTDQQLFNKARLITTALVAKIHTVEWTPAILPHPIIETGMNTNWYGLLEGDLQDAIGFIDDKTRAIFGRSYADEPDRLIAQLAADEAIQEADTLLLTVPNQLGVEYNAHVIEAILKHVAPDLGWR